MKHNSKFMIGIMSIIMLGACTSVDSLIDKMEAAVNNGDLIEATQIAEEIAKKEKNGTTLSTEQTVRIASISAKMATKSIEDFGSFFSKEDDDEE